jgi:hypothetical protein
MHSLVFISLIWFRTPCCGLWCILSCIIVSVILSGIIIGIVLIFELREYMLIYLSHHYLLLFYEIVINSTNNHFIHIDYDGYNIDRNIIDNIDRNIIDNIDCNINNKYFKYVFFNCVNNWSKWEIERNVSYMKRDVVGSWCCGEFSLNI